MRVWSLCGLASLETTDSRQADGCAALKVGILACMDLLSACGALLCLAKHQIPLFLFACGCQPQGIVGESKIGILSELMTTSPELTAEAFLIEAGSAAIRLARISELCLQHEIGMPFVLKPNIAQRGAGFKKIQSVEEVREYLSRVSAPLILQRYVAAPYEAGIFYYRFPGEPQGHILGITQKVSPYVTGDGIRTIRELIEADSRASYRPEEDR